MRLFGSFAVLALVNFFFIPFMRRQNAMRRFADVGLRLASAFLTGGLISLLLRTPSATSTTSCDNNTVR